MVVPLRIGGGSRLKILEAMAAGTPVISTRVGAEGLNVRHGEHLVVVENCDKMARAILDRGRGNLASSRMVQAGRRLVEDRYDWDTLADRLDAIWRNTAWSATEAPMGSLPSLTHLEPTRMLTVAHLTARRSMAAPSGKWSAWLSTRAVGRTHGIPLLR